MTPDPTAFDPAAPAPSAAVGAFVHGPPDGPRQVVRWADQLRDHHELAAHVDPDAEAYLSVYSYPPADYLAHYRAAGSSPRGYAGPAAGRHLVFDVDRPGDTPAALADARALVRVLLARYGPKLDAGVGAYFSGAKGFHVTLELLPGYGPAPGVPAACRRLALSLAAAAGVRVDTACYDHQRLLRLPNSRHPRTGRYKRPLALDELLGLDTGRLAELARHPAGTAVPSAGEFSQELQDDFDRAAAEVAAVRRPAAGGRGGWPAVPAFVRDFIGFADIQDPGRAVTLFRCAAALAEAGTPEPVVRGLLEEPALKTGIDAREVERQLRDGVAHGRRAGGWPA